MKATKLAFSPLGEKLSFLVSQQTEATVFHTLGENLENKQVSFPFQRKLLIAKKPVSAPADFSPNPQFFLPFVVKPTEQRVFRQTAQKTRGKFYVRTTMSLRLMAGRIVVCVLLIAGADALRCGGLSSFHTCSVMRMHLRI